MKKVIRCKRHAKLLGGNQFKKVRNGLLDDHFTQFLHSFTKKNVHSLVPLPFLSPFFWPRIKCFMVTTSLKDDQLGSRLKTL